MASRKGYQLLQESDEGSNDSISNSGSSAEPTTEDRNDNRGFTAASPPVLEPSKDEWRRPEGIHGLEKRFTSSCLQPSTKEVPISSSGETNNPEDEQLNGNEYQNNDAPPVEELPTSFCITFWNRYNDYARIIRNSWFIYIFQLFVGLLVVSCLVMGMLFFTSCSRPYPSTGPVLTILVGLSGFLFVYKWVAVVRRERGVQRYWNLERFRLAVRFTIFFFLFVLEWTFFSQVSPGNILFIGEKKCDPIYYFCMYYWHIANTASLVLLALLYLPAIVMCFINWDFVAPSDANGLYQPL